jgi:UPF0271 protein
MKSIDLNADVGERPDALADGTEEKLIRLITSANVACGVHAGDFATMETVVALAMKYGVGVGAHPSFPDRTNFGRKEMNLPAEQLSQTVFNQVRTLGMVCERLGATMQHVKPHGALYTMAARDADVARSFCKGVEQWSKDLILVGLAGSVMVDVWKTSGFRVAAEAFVDRRYEPDGSLRSRSFPDALIVDPKQAVHQAIGIARDGLIVMKGGNRVTLHPTTICIHSDTPGAVAIAELVRQKLEENGVVLTRLALQAL